MFNIQFLKKGRKYINDSLLTGLVSYWKLNEASGTRVDSVGSNNLTDNNTVTRVLGKQSGAANFTSANSEYLSIASNDSLNVGGTSFTFVYWVNLKDKAASNYAFVSKYDQSLTNQLSYYTDFIQSTDRFRFVISPDGTSASQVAVAANTFGSPTIGVWYFIICEYNVATDIMSISVNNGTADTQSVADTFSGTSPFEIGKAGNLNRYPNAYVDEVGFWKRILTTEEKARLYNAGNGITYPFNYILDRLVSYWAMEQTSGNRTDSNLATTLIDNNSVTYGSGIIRNGAQFALASSQYLSTVTDDTALFSFGDTDYTIAAWVNLDSIATSQTIVSKYSSDTVRDYFLQYATSASDFFRFIVYDGTTTTIGTVSSAAGINTGSWYFVVAYHDATNNLVGISINGATPTTAATTGTAASTASLFYAGGRQGGAALQYMDGRTDEVGVWRRVLSNAEIAYLYNNGKGKTYPLSGPMSQI